MKKLIVLLMLSNLIYGGTIDTTSIYTGGSISSSKMLEIVNELNSRPIVKSCHVYTDSTWDTNDPGCSFLTLFRQSSPTSTSRYYMETNLGVQVNKCIVKHHSACGNAPTSTSSDLSGYESTPPVGALGGFKGCNGSYDTIGTQFTIICVVNP